MGGTTSPQCKGGGIWNRYNQCRKVCRPTAYEALTNIQREERDIKVFRPIVYVCSPYSGNVEANVEAARKYCRFAVDAGYLPIAPHLLYPQFLNDRNAFERKLGIRFGDILMDRCSEVWAFGSQISAGMKAEISRAQRKGYTLRFFDAECKEVTHNGSRGNARTQNRF
jgi:hypothetical protein